ncbi:hypothetical protein OPV22_025980 [Ensete ventricosum]|uniref:Uncharacterized protein n=1 Tax=Ensete ventricosum TaxID=4639 RepID=A0AAV8Q9E2_ENSVE|nr:hypothetical protein OPV22_025980 [Ensete ventricosum]
MGGAKNLLFLPFFFIFLLFLVLLLNPGHASEECPYPCLPPPTSVMNYPPPPPSEPAWGYPPPPSEATTAAPVLLRFSYSSQWCNLGAFVHSVTSINFLVAGIYTYLVFKQI